MILSKACRRPNRYARNAIPSSAGRSAKGPTPGPGREVAGQQQDIGHCHLGPGTRWPVVERVGRHGGISLRARAMLARGETRPHRCCPASCAGAGFKFLLSRRPTGRLRTRWLTGRRRTDSQTIAHRPIVMTGPCHCGLSGHRRSTCGQRLDWATSASLENSSFWWCGGRWTASVTSVQRRAWISASSESSRAGCRPCHSTARLTSGCAGSQEHVTHERCHRRL